MKMLIKYLISIFLSIGLYANTTLKNTYYVDSRIINLSTILPTTKNDSEILIIEKNRHSKRIKAKELVKILENHGLKEYKFKGNYVNFILKSPIDMTKIKENIIQYYYEQYDEIDIKNVSVQPRSYIDKLPQDYIVNFRKKDFLSKNATINIKTKKNQKIFFNYTITAFLPIYISKGRIKKNVELSAMNSTRKEIVLDKFRAKPIQNIYDNSLQTKRHINKGKILTIRDIETLNIVRRNAHIGVDLYDNNMIITFSAKALQDGKIGDIIKVQKRDGKKLKVMIIGKNRAEIK